MEQTHRFWVNVYPHGVGGMNYPLQTRATEEATMLGQPRGVSVEIELRWDAQIGRWWAFTPHVSQLHAKDQNDGSMTAEPLVKPLDVGASDQFGQPFFRGSVDEVSTRTVPRFVVEDHQAERPQLNPLKARKYFLREFLGAVSERMRAAAAQEDHRSQAFELVGAELLLVNAALAAYFGEG